MAGHRDGQETRRDSRAIFCLGPVRPAGKPCRDSPANFFPDPVRLAKFFPGLDYPAALSRGPDLKICETGTGIPTLPRDNRPSLDGYRFANF